MLQHFWLQPAVMNFDVSLNSHIFLIKKEPFSPISRTFEGHQKGPFLCVFITMMGTLFLVESGVVGLEKI